MIKELQEELRNDKEFFYVWQSNIAMCMCDAYRRNKKKYKSQKDMHEICNEGAIEFLNRLIK